MNYGGIIIKGTQNNNEFKEHTYQRLVEYYQILSKRQRTTYHVFLDTAMLYGRQQQIIFVYQSRGNNMYLEYCYPLTRQQFLFLEKNAQSGFKSTSMSSGHASYLDCYYAFSSIIFPLGEEIDFNVAFGYMIDFLERHLQDLRDSEDKYQ